MKDEQFTKEKKEEIIIKCIEVCHKEGLHIGQCREIFEEAYYRSRNKWYCDIWGIVVMKHVREESKPVKQEIEIKFPTELANELKQLIEQASGLKSKDGKINELESLKKEVAELKEQVAELQEPNLLDVEVVCQKLIEVIQAMGWRSEDKA
jgi:DNA-binding transcriptional MerR regulator